MSRVAFALVRGMATSLLVVGLRPVMAEQDVIAAYDFAEGAGDVLHDRSGHANHGKIHGAKWVEVGDGHALRFDGADDYVDCGDAPIFEPISPITLEAWVLPEELPHGEGFLLGRGLGSYALTYSGGAYPARVFWHIGAVKKKCRARAVATLWHHVVATFDGTLLKVYIDGALAGGVRAWKQQPAEAGRRFLMAGGAAGLKHFKGMLGSVRVYRRVLSPEEAFVRYQAGKRRYANPPPDRRPFAGSGVKVLNNLVAELLNVPEPVRQDGTEYRFTNPRDGWVYISTTATVSGTGRVRVLLDDASEDEAVIVHDRPGESSAEAMRLLPAGAHRLRVRCEESALLDHVVVRAIPELIFGSIPTQPAVSEFGPYTWEFLEPEVLRNATTLVGLPKGRTRVRAAAWKKQGRRWIAEHSAGWYDYAKKKPSRTVDDFYQTLVTKPGMNDPLTDGVLLDTHDVGHNNRYGPYSEAIRRIHRQESFANKTLYFYCDCLYGAPMSERFARTVRECGYRFVWTRYLHEQPTQQRARSFIEVSLADEAAGWERFMPGWTEQAVVALGYLTSPGERMDVEPGANYLVFMDMQCNLLANHPAFRGLGGVMWYKAHYANEEPLVWGARLFRHYFIEGHTEMLSKDPYELDHIRNPDFNEGAKGWDLFPAEKGSIQARYVNRYGFLQGRWLETGAGDHFLWTRRSSAGPNRFSQQIRNLQPGRLYSLTMYTGDYRKDVVERKSVKQKHAVAILLDDVEVLPDKRFQYVYPNFSYYHLGPYDDEEPKEKTWLNFHHLVFRAKGQAGRLTICDWIKPDDPGGPIGQELMFNFIQVQPYVLNE